MKKIVSALIAIIPALALADSPQLPRAIFTDPPADATMEHSRPAAVAGAWKQPHISTIGVPACKPAFSSGLLDCQGSG